MKIWLVGSGYWGSKIAAKLTKLGIEHQIIDIKNGQTIDDINTPDPVMLATPLWEHYAQALQLIHNGHDVYIEKPAAENSDQVIDLLKSTKDNIVMVGHIYMYNPILHKLKSMIDTGVLGEIQFIGSVRTNLGIYQTKTTPLLSLAPHDFTIIDHLLGGDLFIKSGRGYKYSPDSPYADRVLVGGYNWHIDVSWAHPERKREVTVIGTKAQAVWNDDAKTLVIHKNNVVDGRLVLNEVKESFHWKSDVDPLQNELEHFIDCVKNRKSPMTDLKYARTMADYIDIAQLLVDFSMQ
jgi:UDP-2-acetamido-3-amino-2,3-dideoxy-glucuronate N-acetyltransferase